MTDIERKTFCAALSRYGAQAQITCEEAAAAGDGERMLDALQELVDKGLGGRFLDLRRALKGVIL